MRTITTILLIVVCLSCKAQEPDTIICYSEEDVQVLLADTVTYYEGVIQAFGDIIESNHHLFYKDSVRIEVHDSAGVYIDLKKHGGTITFIVSDSIGRLIRVHFYPNMVRSDFIYKGNNVIDYNLPEYLYRRE